jgi:hypothetical protein
MLVTPSAVSCEWLDVHPPSQFVDPPLKSGIPTAAPVARDRERRSESPIRDLEDASIPGRRAKSTSMKREIMSLVT